MDLVSSLRRQAAQFLPKAKAALSGVVPAPAADKSGPVPQAVPEAFPSTCAMVHLDEAMRPLRDRAGMSALAEPEGAAHNEAAPQADSGAATSFLPTTPERVRDARLSVPSEHDDHPRLFGCHGDVSAEELSRREDLQYPLEGVLLSTLITAFQNSAKWRKPVVVNTFQGLVLLDARCNLVCVNMEPAQWDGLLTRPLVRRPAMQVVDDVDDVTFEARPIRQARLDQLLWRTGLETAIGRLPAGTDPHKTVYLKHWPNLTRMESVPHGIRIAALWATQGAGLLETSELLKIPQRYVFAFYSAALAQDLIAEKKPQVRRPRSSSSSTAGLLRRLVESMA